MAHRRRLIPRRERTAERRPTGRPVEKNGVHADAPFSTTRVNSYLCTHVISGLFHTHYTPATPATPAATAGFVVGAAGKSPIDTSSSAACGLASKAVDAESAEAASAGAAASE
jgi:hypothetical protein